MKIRFLSNYDKFKNLMYIIREYAALSEKSAGSFNARNLKQHSAEKLEPVIDTFVKNSEKVESK